MASIGRPKIPPALLISSIAKKVAARCVLSIAAVTPVSENSTPTRQLLGCISKSPSEGRCRVRSKAAYRSHLVFAVPPDPKDGFQIWDTQEAARRP